MGTTKRILCWILGLLVLPTVMITDTAFYRNHLYHSPGDTAERLDYKRMAAVVVGVYEAVKALAGEE